MQDIISSILERRKQDAAEKGFCMGCNVPDERTRPVVPFLPQRGVILEVKRASPSKGDIAPGLDAAATTRSYIEAGASAVSVLTEEHWFKGSLDDLAAAANVAGERAAVLRKDFLYHPDEVDVSYRCGADAVLVIARMLDEDAITAMLERVAQRGMSALVEIRSDDDVHKVRRALSALSASSRPQSIVYGVNARDLRDFSIDMMKPLGVRRVIEEELGDKELDAAMPSDNEPRIITESGVLTPQAARMAGSMGFYGLLLGEAAARRPSDAVKFVEAFLSGQQGRCASFWQQVAVKRSIIDSGVYRPLIKICGLTRTQDAMAASSLGADALGFVFWQKSKRCANEKTVRETRKMIEGITWSAGKKPLLVGVVADKSLLSQAAMSLAREGVLDAVQFHGCLEEEIKRAEYSDIGHYAAVSVGIKADIERIRALVSAGQMRVLVDAKTKTLPGGTGVKVDGTLCKEAAKVAPLWLAGGITADNVSKIIKEYHPELIDVASGVESNPGIKSEAKMQKLITRALTSGGIG